MADQIRTVDDLVRDPLIQLVMKSYGVREGDVRSLFDAARTRVTERAAVPPAHVIKACQGFGACA
jgi:hypothetical protein